MPSPNSLPPTAVSVAPTTTTLGTFDTQRSKLLSLAVRNDDVSQTLACVIQRRAMSRETSGGNASDFSDTSIPDLASIAPGVTAAVDVDCAANAEVRVVGTASGAGLTATISARAVLR